MNYNKEKFLKLREETKKKYEAIKFVRNKALNKDIYFNSDGFHHLRYDKTRVERSKLSQYNKFINLDKAVDILTKSATVQEYRRAICKIGKPDKSGFYKTSVVEWFGFFAITSFSEQRRLMVVVRRVGGDDGRYHFWSVMPYWKLNNNTRIIGSKVIEDE